MHRLPALLLVAAALAGCAGAPSATDTPLAAGDAGQGVPPAPCCHETTTDAWEASQPSAVALGLTFMNPGTAVRDAPPDGLTDTLVEARLTPNEGALGGIAMRVFAGGGGGSAQVTFCGDEVGRVDVPDADGVHRFHVPEGAWTDGQLCILLECNGEPAGARQSVRVETWTTTFAGMAMPEGFTAVA